jgi:hypothetical protein
LRRDFCRDQKKGTYSARENPEERKWYHPLLSEVDADCLLKGAKLDGAFLVRNGKGKGNFYLSVFADGMVQHIPLVKDRTSETFCVQFSSSKLTFDSIPDLIRHHAQSEWVLCWCVCLSGTQPFRAGPPDREDGVPALLQHPIVFGELKGHERLWTP